jgi:hypothetical protein
MKIFLVDAFGAILIIANFVVWGLVLTRLLEWLR